MLTMKTLGRITFHWYSNHWNNSMNPDTYLGKQRIKTFKYQVYFWGDFFYKIDKVLVFSADSHLIK